MNRNMLIVMLFLSLIIVLIFTFYYRSKDIARVVEYNKEIVYKKNASYIFPDFTFVCNGSTEIMVPRTKLKIVVYHFTVSQGKENKDISFSHGLGVNEPEHFVMNGKQFDLSMDHSSTWGSYTFMISPVENRTPKALTTLKAFLTWRTSDPQDKNREANIFFPLKDLEFFALKDSQGKFPYSWYSFEVLSVKADQVILQQVKDEKGKENPNGFTDSHDKTIVIKKWGSTFIGPNVPGGGPVWEVSLQ